MDREKRTVAEALRSHFVFNVMNVLRYMIKKKPDKAGEMVYDLSLYMRCKLDAIDDEGSTTFQKEWNATDAYLRLEQVALPNLKYDMNVNNTEYSFEKGVLLETVETLVKEEIRVTKDTRTIQITDCRGEAEGIKIGVKETDVWIQL